MTFEEITELVRADYKANGRKSLWRAELAIKRLAEHFAGMRALSLPGRSQAYIVARQAEKASAATIRYELSILRRGFTLAYQSRQLPQRPYIPSLEVRNTRQGFFEEKELRKVLKHLPETVRPVVEFAYLMGWRRGEVLSHGRPPWRAMRIWRACQPGSYTANMRAVSGTPPVTTMVTVRFLRIWWSRDSLHNMIGRTQHFDPETLAIQSGETVTWRNVDTAPHDANTDSYFKDIATGVVKPGCVSRAFSLEPARSYNYFCDADTLRSTPCVIIANP